MICLLLLALFAHFFLMQGSSLSSHVILSTSSSKSVRRLHEILLFSLHSFDPACHFIEEELKEDFEGGGGGTI